MDLSRLRGGELIAAAAGIVLLVALLFLNWYGVGASFETPIGNFSASADIGAWDHQGFLGTLANLVILAAGIVAVGLGLLTAMSRTVALPVAASALTAGLGIGAVMMVIGRMLFQPGVNEAVDLKFGIWLALIGAVGVAYGGWQSMQEEGTTFEGARREGRAAGSSRPGESAYAGPPPPSDRPYETGQTAGERSTAPEPGGPGRSPMSEPGADDPGAPPGE
jgi:hypothetical protein